MVAVGVAAAVEAEEAEVEIAAEAEAAVVEAGRLPDRRGRGRRCRGPRKSCGSSAPAFSIGAA
jgi:hypothetical protein